MSDDLRQQVQEYQQLVQRYHALDEEIDALLTAHQGHTENMSEEAMAQYRSLARQRDDVFNAMRQMEQNLFTDEEVDS
jgi:cell division protein FtsB